MPSPNKPHGLWETDNGRGVFRFCFVRDATIVAILDAGSVDEAGAQVPPGQYMVYVLPYAWPTTLDQPIKGDDWASPGPYTVSPEGRVSPVPPPLQPPPERPPVAGLLQDLAITVEELAGIIRSPVGEVEAWANGTADPPGPADILMAYMGPPGSDAALIVFRDRRGRAALASGVAYKHRDRA
ncbi:hypothetical protein HNR56_003502 [Roseospira marina]|nr:hypothetical protein [Roseospira marina]MBB5088789.1 hypothetical protein [Roseospira marina]